MSDSDCCNMSLKEFLRSMIPGEVITGKGGLLLTELWLGNLHLPTTTRASECELCCVERDSIFFDRKEINWDDDIATQ